ncbi:MAG: lipid-A-disaccharide synthase N-terminal domain-containing protein [Minisyncoccia bacterium]
MQLDYVWLFIGFLGQGIFFLRFIVQWWMSEKEKKVVIPKSFWYLSIAGTIVILVYSIHIHDIVFITAQVLSLFIYVRNMSFA